MKTPGIDPWLGPKWERGFWKETFSKWFKAREERILFERKRDKSKIRKILLVKENKIIPEKYCLTKPPSGDHQDLYHIRERSQKNF